MSPLLGKRVSRPRETTSFGTVVGVAYDRDEWKWDILVLHDGGELCSYWHDSIVVGQ